ncbi:MAG: DUF3089 domain-containing protein [Agarilytica sp.]
MKLIHSTFRTVRYLSVSACLVFASGCQDTSNNTQDAQNAIEAKKAHIIERMTKLFKPHKTFEAHPLPPTPDYSDENFWAALPTTEDSADLLPTISTLTDNQDGANVDVFYVHPTTFTSKDAWNADAKTPLVFGKFDPIKVQASIFNGSARVYAPRYRQATLFAFHGGKSADQAKNVAKQDIQNAFQYYLKNYNNGRPFILAGHSQGTLVLAPILEYLDTHPLPNFITAYIPGIAVKADQFNTIKPCTSATDIYCFNVWNTKRWGVPQEELVPSTRNAGSACVNPMNWKNDDSIATAESHLGAIHLDFDHFDKHIITKAKCHNESLWVEIPDQYQYYSSFDKNWFHLMDFNLFYMNVRENVKQRISTFQTQTQPHKLNKQ